MWKNYVYVIKYFYKNYVDILCTSKLQYVIANIASTEHCSLEVTFQNLNKYTKKTEILEEFLVLGYL